MRNLIDGLEEAGLGLSNVVATNVYLDDMNDFPRMNKIYAQYFPEAPPAPREEAAPTWDTPPDYSEFTPPSNLKPIVIMGVFIIALTVAAAAFIIWAKHEQGKPQAAKPGAAKAERPQARDSFDPDFALFKGGLATYLIILFVIAVVYTLMLIWVVRDARNRSVDNGVMWMIVVFSLQVFGLLIYLASRPHGRLILCEHCMNKRLEYVRTCPHCGRRTKSHDAAPGDVL